MPPGRPGSNSSPKSLPAGPRVSDEGHTYTFRIRPGYRFSPPSNEPVTAASFGREIERVLVAQVQPGPWKLALLPDVVGAVAYHAGKSPHVSGVSFHGDCSSSARQAGVRPPGSARRAGLLCGTRRDANRVERHRVADPLRRPVLPRRTCGDAFVLKRNPNYPGPRPQHLDAIVYRTGIDVSRAVSLVAKDKVDYVAESDAALGPGTVAARSAPGRYRLTPNNWTERLVLNPHRPLFADARLRRAVAYALDRRALASGLAGVIVFPTSDVLPPGAPGARGVRAYPLGSDPSVARRLIGGRRRPRDLRGLR